MCLHDIDDMPHAVAEIARVLGRSGRLYAAIPHPINTAGTFQGRDAGAPRVRSTGRFMSSMAATPGGRAPWLHDQLSQMAALPPLDADGDMPLGLFVLSDERGAVTVWEISVGKISDRPAPSSPG